MRYSTLSHLFVIFLLGSSTLVVSVPVHSTTTDADANEAADPPTNAAAAAGTTSTPGSPRNNVPMPSKKYPPVIPRTLTEACEDAEKTVLGKCMRRESLKHNPGLPNEDGLSDDVVDTLIKFGIEEVIPHTKSQEGGVGGSGVDFMFQFTITGVTAKKMTEGVDPGGVTTELEKLELEEQKGEGSSTSRRKAGTSNPVTPRLLPASAGRTLRSAGGPSTPKLQGPRVIVIAQAKSYHKTGDQGHERTAKFTYKTGNTGILQMHLLENYAKTVQDKPENQGVLVLPGYLVYGLVADLKHQRKGISWIPLTELLTKLEELQKGGIKEADLDQELSKHFIDKEIKKADNYESKCWLEDILHDHFAEF